MKNSNSGVAITHTSQDGELDPYAINKIVRNLMNPGTGFIPPRRETPQPSQSNIEQEDVRTPKEMLEEWKSGGLPISTIAEMMNVERKTIYSWLDGSTFMRNQYHERRMVRIHRLLKDGKCASYRNLYRYWNVEINKETLANLITHATLDEHKIAVHLKAIWPLAQRSENNSKVAETAADFPEREAYISTEE